MVEANRLLGRRACRGRFGGRPGPVLFLGSYGPLVFLGPHGPPVFLTDAVDRKKLLSPQTYQKHTSVPAVGFSGMQRDCQ